MMHYDDPRIWRDYRAGRISAGEMTERQAALMPPCSCGKPSSGQLDDGPICVDCLDALSRVLSDRIAYLSLRRDGEH